MQITIKEKQLIEHFRKLTTIDQGHIIWLAKVLVSVASKLKREGAWQ